MPQLVSDLYLYLARRDKSGIRILDGQITQIIYDARMLWEPWVESANTFEELRASLKIRGYTNIVEEILKALLGIKDKDAEEKKDGNKDE